MPSHELIEDLKAERTRAAEVDSKQKTQSKDETDSDVDVFGILVAILCAWATGGSMWDILSEHGMGPAAYKAIFQVLLLTAPLVAAVACSCLVVLGWSRSEQAKQGHNGQDWQVLLVVTFAIWGAAFLLGKAGLGMGPVEYEELISKKVGHLPFRMAISIVNMVYSFYKAYGLILFLSAFSLGGWISWKIETNSETPLVEMATTGIEAEQEAFKED